MDKDLIDFANKITPPNWKIAELDEVPHIKFHPRMVLIDIWNFEEEGEDEESIVGMATPVMLKTVSIFALEYGNAQKALNKYGDFYVCTSELRLNLDFIGEDIIIHELSHIAATRMIMRYTTGIYTGLFYGYSHNFFEKNQNPHGRIFQRAYKILIDRAEKVFGKKKTEINRSNLEDYQNECNEE